MPYSKTAILMHDHFKIIVTLQMNQVVTIDIQVDIDFSSTA